MKRIAAVTLLVALITLAAAGAATTADAYVVLGVRPDNLKVCIEPATVDGNYLILSHRSWSATYSDYPDGEFIVAKVPAGEWQVIRWIMVGASKGSMWSDSGMACFWAEYGCGHMVFNVPAGKVFYYGDIVGNETASPRAMMLELQRTPIEDVRAYLVAHHPELAERLEAHEPVVMYGRAR